MDGVIQKYRGCKLIPLTIFLGHLERDCQKSLT